MTRRSKIRGYRVVKTKSGKTIVEEIPGYAMNASRKIQMKKSTKQTVVRRTP